MFPDEVKYFSLKHAWKKTLFNIFVTRVDLTVCYYHATYVFQSEFTLYTWLNVKELLTRNRRVSSWVFVYELSGCGLESRCSHYVGWNRVAVNNLFCPVFVFRRCVSNGISDFILCFKNEDLSISWISPTIPF